MNASTIVNLRTVVLDRTGTQVLRTRRGERKFGVAWVLADGSLLVSKDQQSEKASGLIQFVVAKRRGLQEGWINPDTSRWDEHEMAMYFRTRRAGLV